MQCNRIFIQSFHSDFYHRTLGRGLMPIPLWVMYGQCLNRELHEVGLNFSTVRAIPSYQHCDVNFMYRGPMV